MYAIRSYYGLDTTATMIDENWALIAIKSPEDPDFLAELDQGRNSRAARAIANAMKPYSSRISNNEIAWLVAFYPTEKSRSRMVSRTVSPRKLIDSSKLPALKFLVGNDPISLTAPVRITSYNVCYTKLLRVRIGGSKTVYKTGFGSYNP